MIHRRTPAVLTALLVLTGTGYLAWANMGLNDGRTLSFAGNLRVAAGTADGMHDFRFGLFTSEPSDNALNCLLANPNPTCTLWDEEQIDTVYVSQGVFTAELGTVATLTDNVLGQPALWLGMAVRDTAVGGAYSKLSGSQKITPTPFASRAAAAKDFKVTGNLVAPTISGNTNVTGNASATNVTARGDVTASDDMATAGSMWVGSSTPSTFGNGYLRVKQGAQFDCDNCGSQSQLQGSADYGVLTVQGRVLSTDTHMHLSPPGGYDVVIDNNYRAAGGTTTGTAGLQVQGDFTRGCPTGMAKIGSSCIENDVSSSNGTTWSATNQACRNAGMRMCTYGEVHYALSYSVIPLLPISTIDRWVWVDSGGTGLNGCYVNTNNDQPSFGWGFHDCGVGIYTSHPSIAGICCK